MFSLQIDESQDEEEKSKNLIVDYLEHSCIERRYYRRVNGANKTSTRKNSCFFGTFFVCMFLRQSSYVPCNKSIFCLCSSKIVMSCGEC